MAKQSSDYYRNRAYDAIYSSDLSRAVDTANILFGGRDIVPKASIREMDFGGLNSSRIDVLSREMVEYREIGQFPDKVFHEGESLHGFYRRVDDFLKELVVEQAGRSIAIIAHGGVINMMLIILLDLDLKKFPLFEIDFCARTDLQFVKDRTFINCINHRHWGQL